MVTPHRRVLGILLAALALLGGAAVVANATPDRRLSGSDWVARPAQFEHVVKLADQRILASDGAYLYADVFLPSHDAATPAPGRFPTVLMITPYNKNFGAESREYLVRRGYASVVAEPRGTGSSEGTWDFGSDRERRDGYDIVEWAAAQPWSSGDVGMVGDSYRGINQWWTAMEQPPSLRTIVPIDAPADMYRTGGASGGEMSSLVVAQSLVGVLGLPPGNRAGEDPRRAAQVAASRPAGIAGAGAGTVDIVGGGRQSYDNPYFHARGGYWNIDRITVPVLLVGGWFDIAQRDSVLMFEELRRAGREVKLLMGPWTHTNFGSGLPSADGAVPHSFDEILLRWFDHHVAGRRDRSLRSFGPIVYNSLNEDRWRSADAWPPRGAKVRDLYFDAGALVESVPQARGADVLPWHPVAGACSRSSQQALIGVPPDNPCTSDGRANSQLGLRYDLPPSPEDRRIAGPIAARLFVSTTRSDAFVNVRLETVAPDGAVTALTDGNDTLSFRALDLARTTVVQGRIVRPFHPYTPESVERITAGSVYEWWIEVHPVAALVPAGHVLRVTVQPSDAAQAIPVGERGAGLAGAVVSVERGGTYPSGVVIPFVP